MFVSFERAAHAREPRTLSRVARRSGVEARVSYVGCPGVCVSHGGSVGECGQNVVVFREVSLKGNMCEPRALLPQADVDMYVCTHTCALDKWCQASAPLFLCDPLP